MDLTDCLKEGMTDQQKKGKWTMMNIPLALGLITTAFFLSILPALGHALTPSQVFDKVKDSVVVVKTLDDQGKVKGQGSGVLISTSRIATNCHVVEGGISYQVGRGNQLVSATLYAEDGDKDICILDAKGISGNPAQLDKAANLKVGVPVYAVGAPQGLELSLSDGIVAQLRGGPPPFIQTTAAISPGSSGGGLFDAEGRLVGLTTFYIEGSQSLNFAMPVEWIDDVTPGRKQIAEGRGQTEWFKRGSALYSMNNLIGLLDLCREWTQSEPGNTIAWISLGQAHRSLKHNDDAIEAFRQALRINPKEISAWSSLGNTYTLIERDNDAIEAYRQALRINPEFADGWSGLWGSYMRLERYNDAIEASRQALRIKPEDAAVWVNLGMSYQCLERNNEAIEAYRRAIRIKPEDFMAWHSLGFMYYKLKRHSDAIEACRQALRIDQKSAGSWHLLGISYGRLNRHSDAIEAVYQAVRIDPKDAVLWHDLGIAYLNSGNRTAALDVVQKIRSLDPALADRLFNQIMPR
jgi:tetratricopeptide (TPR) repeat protein